MQIVYYSNKGTTERLARQLASSLDLPLFRIEDVSSRQGTFGFIRSGFEASFRKCPRIRPMTGYEPDPKHVILMAPIWAGKMCSPLRTFCTQNAGKFQTFSLVLTHLDTKNRYETVSAEVENVLGAKCQVFESFCSNSIDQADVQKLISRLEENARQ
jgi:flavodoxin